MFCADYIASFVHHGFLQLLVSRGYVDGDRLRRVLPPAALHPACGACAGFLAACSVYPFDFVRRGIIAGGASFAHSLSVVPYSAAFFGLYFAGRDPSSLRSQCGCALAASAAAAAVEVPFDRAKMALMGSRRTMLFVSALYVPFGALMLVMYDKASVRLDSKLVQS